MIGHKDGEKIKSHEKIVNIYDVVLVFRSMPKSQSEIQ